MQFAFTITFHYLFPQVTMGLTLIIFILASIGLRHDGAHFHICVHFLTKLLAIAFAAGVVTGIPMELSVRDKVGRVLRLQRIDPRADAVA